MRVQSFYRNSLWIPLLIPGLVGYAVYTLGIPVHTMSMPLRKIVQLLLMVLIYGGIPYVLLAAWAAWWIDDRPEPEIRRRALQAPVWMLGVWTAVAALSWMLSGEVEVFLGLLGLGTLFIAVWGYACVALVFLLRIGFARAGWIEPSS